MSSSVEQTEGFRVSRDMYNGLSIDLKQQHFQSDQEFEQKLSDAVPKWKVGGVRGLWITIPSTRSSLIPVCVKNGFDFHHAKPGKVKMCQWLPDDEPNKLNPYANQFLGVGGFVVNSKSQLLVITERYTAGLPHWKLPGGLAESGEDLEDTAKREVFEETGVECEFVRVLCFRHQHNYKYGCSDWYYVCLMRPIKEDIVPCPHEIADCKWMDLDEYLTDPKTTDGNRFIAQCYKDGLSNGNMAIVPQEILSYNKKTHHKYYSIQPTDKHLLHQQSATK